MKSARYGNLLRPNWLIGTTLVAFALWHLVGHDVVTVKVDLPGNRASLLYVEVDATYRYGNRRENKKLISQFLRSNESVSFSIPFAAPWRFESLSLRISHPGLLTVVKSTSRNPHLWRVSLYEAPALLSMSSGNEPVAVSDVERHYEMVEDLFVVPLGLREAAVQAWPDLQSLRNLFTRASFILDDQGDLAEELKRERMQRIGERWLALEARLASVQFLPCVEDGVSFRQEDPGETPGCGLKLVDQHLRH